MNRMLAIVEREMRKFFRSPMLMIMSMMLPLVQLVILGNAFGGKITNARVGVVDEDHGSQAVKVREAFDSVAATIKTSAFPSPTRPEPMRIRSPASPGSLRRSRIRTPPMAGCSGIS